MPEFDAFRIYQSAVQRALASFKIIEGTDFSSFGLKWMHMRIDRTRIVGPTWLRHDEIIKTFHLTLQHCFPLS